MIFDDARSATRFYSRSLTEFQGQQIICEEYHMSEAGSCHDGVVDPVSNQDPIKIDSLDQQ